MHQNMHTIQAYKTYKLYSTTIKTSSWSIKRLHWKISHAQYTTCIILYEIKWISNTKLIHSWSQIIPISMLNELIHIQLARITRVWCCSRWWFRRHRRRYLSYKHLVLVMMSMSKWFVVSDYRSLKANVTLPIVIRVAAACFHHRRWFPGGYFFPFG